MKNMNLNNEWAIILGGSSGFGLASAKKLAKEGFNVFIVHRDRKGAMAQITPHFEEIKANTNICFESINSDALGIEGRESILKKLSETLGTEGKIKLLLHSIALGNLRPLVSANGANTLQDEDMSQTIYSMGTSLLSWVQAIFKNNLFATDARVLGLTSEGNAIAWKGYAAVAAAKSVLESISRSIAVEFAPYGIRCNILQPGVTITPALKLIPGHEKMEIAAKERNPFKKLTTTEDVANVIYLMSQKEAAWINGSLIRVDGGEHISPYEP